jgi:branched-chain amino acid transport system permease protein
LDGVLTDAFLGLAQLLVNGLALGAAYALVALGFVLVLNATGTVNFAQGDLVMAGGYVAIALAAVLPVPGLLLLPLVLVLMAALGWGVSLAAWLPGRPPAAGFIATIAIGIILQESATELFGAGPRATPPVLGTVLGTGRIELGGLVLGTQSLAILVTAAALILGQHLLLTRTRLGRMLRASAQDAEMARLLGIPVPRMIAASFALGSALAGAAGLLLANRYFVTPSSGTDFILKAYMAVTLGGWGSLAGAVLGAFAIALFEVVVSAYASYTTASAALYIVVLALLFLRPEGLFAGMIRRRA